MTTAATLLKTPLWYAAKWGGFVDQNDNLLPDLPSEWDGDSDGVPDTYFYVVNPLKLEQQLSRTFADILSRGVSHVAPVVSVDEANRTQSGDKLYMAFFKPMYDNYWKGNLKKYGWWVRTNVAEPIQSDGCGSITDDSLLLQRPVVATVPSGRKPFFWSTGLRPVDKGGVGARLKDECRVIVVPKCLPLHTMTGEIFTLISTNHGALDRFIPTNANITNGICGFETTDQVRSSTSCTAIIYDATTDADSSLFLRGNGCWATLSIPSPKSLITLTAARR
jgi:hypothetical protein